MKKIYLMLLLAGLMACNKENPDGGSDEQALTCEISIPEDGTTIDLAEIQALTIKGDAEVNTGEIAAVELKIGDNVIDCRCHGSSVRIYLHLPGRPADRRAHDLTYRDRG